MKIIAYTFDADIHCVNCTRERFKDETATDVDENEVPYDAEDSKGNNVHPVFDIDENADEEYCGDCFEKCMW